MKIITGFQASAVLLAGLLPALAVTTLLASTPAAAQVTRPPQATQA